ncbi:hypothetical protein [Micromonospora sp. WMMD737]|uniref:hypothetical protein n=1 Tax=Micromonospora sp. WMMD737 TaxID=3404113 RepID=UPI003B95640E
MLCRATAFPPPRQNAKSGGVRLQGVTSPLPRAMTATDVIDEVIAELERRTDLSAWQDSHWLAGELVLDIDTDGTATVAGFDLHYHPEEGLRVTRANT